MQIKRYWFADLAPEKIEEIRQRQETVVVLDLWAATTNIVLMLAKNPARLILVNDDKYEAAKGLYPEAILIGESQKTPKEKFVSSNDPIEIDRVDIPDRVVLYMTANGTKVLETFSTKEKGLVFAGSLVNYRSLVDYLMTRSLEKVIIVAAGNLSGEMAGKIFIEDWLGAEIFERELTGQEHDLLKAKEEIKRAVVAIYQYQTSLPPAERFWPFIFAPESNVLPTAFINSDGFVEVVDYLSRKE